MMKSSPQTKKPRDPLPGGEAFRFLVESYFATGAGVAVLVFFTFAVLWCFLAFTAGLVSVVPAAGGLAGGVCAANIGSEAAANAIVIRVFFMAFFSLAGLTARSHFHLAARHPKTR